MKYKGIIGLFYCCLFNLITPISLFAQGQVQYPLNTITTAVPFLRFNPDVISWGKGGLGVTSTSFYPEAGIYHNPALLATGRKYIAAKLPFMPQNYRVLDQTYNYAGLVWGITPKHALAIDFTYFTGGTVTFTDNNGNNIGQFKPKEFALSAKYGVAVGRTINLGLGMKYIYSDLTNGYGITGVGSSVAADIGFNYRDTASIYSTGKLQWNIGMTLQNIGTKISYSKTTTQKDFIPQNLKLGLMVTLLQKAGTKSYFAFDLGYEINKLLVPSPPIYKKDNNGTILRDSNGNRIIEKGKNPNVGIFTAMIQSFYDAPNGSTEEWQEVNHLVGFETRQVFNNQFYWALRSGYFYEANSKGGLQFATLGLGGGFWGFSINGLYLINTSPFARFTKPFGFQIGYTCNLGAKRMFFKE